MAKERRDWHTIGRLLVACPGGIGDVVMLSPVLRALRLQMPQVEIGLLTSQAGRRVAPFLPGMAWVWVYEPEAGREGPSMPQAEPGLAAEIRGRRFDAAFIFTGPAQSSRGLACLCREADIPIRVGYAEGAEDGADFLSEPITAPVGGMHQVDRYLYLLHALGLDADGHRLELLPPAETGGTLDRIFDTPGFGPQAEYVFLFPGEQEGAARRKADLGEAVRMIAARIGVPFVGYFGADAVHLIDPAVGVADHGGVQAPCPPEPLPLLIALIQRAGLVMTGDMDIVQIADAFQRPILILPPARGCGMHRYPRNSCVRFLGCENLFSAPGVMLDELVDAAVSLLNRRRMGRKGKHADEGWDEASIVQPDDGQEHWLSCCGEESGRTRQEATTGCAE